MITIRRAAAALAALVVSVAGLAVAAPPAYAATPLNALVIVDVGSFQRLPGDDAGWWCDSTPEYLVKTDVGMFERDRVDAAEHQYEDPSPYEAWSFAAGSRVDLSGTVRTFTSPDYPAQEWISGRISVVEDDDALCGGTDEVLDVNPQPGRDPSALWFLVEPSTGRVFAYNYRDPLWIIGWLSEPGVGTCAFGPGDTCSGTMTVRAGEGWTTFTIRLVAL
jgi:hypothetical protein